MPEGDPLSELEEQTRRGSLFVQSLASEQIARTNRSEAAIYGLIDLLIRKGALSSDEVAEAIEQTEDDLRRTRRHAKLDVAIRIDDGAPTVPAEEIDCTARIPYCRAACCKMRWAMTLEEVESGPVKWDLGRPFFNRHAANGYCHQFDTASHGCNVYDQRPSPCRQYSCVEDSRIWLDFERMIPNTEWIEGMYELGPVELFLSSRDQD